MNRHITLFAVLLGTVSFSAGAQAGNFLFVRHGDPDRIFKQDEAIVIEIPDNLSSDELNSLFLELDGVDITQRVTLEGTRVVFYPASPYGSGSHALRLVRMGKNGKLVEINRWSFNVAGGVPPVETDSSVNGTVEGNYSYRVWDNYDSDSAKTDRHNLNAQTEVSAASQQGNWNITFKGNGFVNTNTAANPSRDGAEVGEYLLRAENSGEKLSTTLNVGNHDIGASNLLMDRFYRRGVSGGLDFWQGVFRMTGFSMNPAASTGNRNFLGVHRDHQRVNGVHATAQPFRALGDAFELEATSYRGEGTTNGAGSSSIDGDESSGDGYQLGLKTQLIKDYLNLRTQYAKVDFDPDGRNTALSSDRDEAYGVTLSINPVGSATDSEGRILQWAIEPSYYRAGSHFASLLNPSAETDREIWKIGNRLAYSNVTLDGEVAWLQDNVNKVDGLPENRSLQAWLQGSYVPEEELWGSPVFSLGATFAGDKRLETPAGSADPGLNRETWSGNAGVVLSFDKTTWTLNHTYTVLYDGVDTLAEYGTHFTDLGLEYRVNDRLTLRPGLQVEWLREDIDGGSTSVHGSLGVQSIIIPEKLWNNTSYSALINNGENPAGSTYNAETEFNWLLKKADTNSPGYALALSGIYNNMTDTWSTSDEENEDARVFVRLKFSAPFSR